MSVTRSIEFYCGKRCVEKTSFFGGKYLDYEFTLDIAYSDISFNDASIKLRSYMTSHNIKIGYCDISYDLGGGYNLVKRYTYFNKNGVYITRKLTYDY